jgi:dihydropteroate synthase
MAKNVKIMGIININDDSFYAQSRANSVSAFRERMNLVIKEGADIVDLGGCSTRPGSTAVSIDIEWKRLLPILDVCKKEYSTVPISIDTFHSEIVKRSYDIIGPFIVNDISAGEDDSNMLNTVVKLNLEYIAMHKRGNSITMQTLCQYENITSNIVQYFIEFEKRAIDTGMKDWIIDPGFGFAKTIEQNYELLDNLSQLRILRKRILVGISRKGFLYKPHNLTPEEALPLTTKYHRVAINNGADILRVHDVAQAKQLLYD